jgi:hypothetical protein
MVMFVKIFAVHKSKGILATHWEFEFSLHDKTGCLMERRISVDEAIGLANRPDAGPVFDMCRMIKSTPPVEFSRLVGRIFMNAS